MNRVSWLDDGLQMVTAGGYVVTGPPSMTGAEGHYVRSLCEEADLRSGLPWVDDPSESLLHAVRTTWRDCVPEWLQLRPGEEIDDNTLRALIAHSGISSHVALVGCTTAAIAQATAVKVLDRHPFAASKPVSIYEGDFPGMTMRKAVRLAHAHFAGSSSQLDLQAHDEDDMGKLESCSIRGESVVQWVLGHWPEDAADVTRQLLRLGAITTSKGDRSHRPSAWAQDRVRRRAIWGHHYATPLAAALTPLESIPNASTWFGGSLPDPTGDRRSYMAGYTLTAEETLAKLQAFLHALRPRYPQRAAEINAAIAEAIPGSITEIAVETAR